MQKKGIKRQGGFTLGHQENFTSILEKECAIILGYLKSEEELLKFLDDDSFPQVKLPFDPYFHSPRFTMTSFLPKLKGDTKYVGDPENEENFIEPESATLRSARKIQRSYKANKEDFARFSEEISPYLKNPENAEKLFEELTALQKLDREEAVRATKQKVIQQKEEPSSPKTPTFADLVKSEIEAKGRASSQGHEK